MAINMDMRKPQNPHIATVLVLALALCGIALFCWLEPRFLWPGFGLAIALILVALLASGRAVPNSFAVENGGSDTLAPPAFSQLDLASAVADPLIVFDRNAIVVHANPAALSAFDPISPGTLLQVRFRALELQSLIEQTLRGASGPEAVDYSERFPVERVYRVSAARLDASQGLWALIFRDHSEARRIDRMRADFIANASHELRTPLASISGFIETLRGPARNDDTARERFLGIMQDQASRMARLLDDLLSLSRVEMKPMLRPGDRADLRDIVEAVLNSSAQRILDAGIILETQIEDGAHVVRGDRDELFQVFENLIENACKYGRSGGRLEVALKDGEDGGRKGIAVSIRDHGPGIPAEHIPRITERFYRVEGEASRNQKGTGLGLAIVKHIVTRHGGRLLIRSKVGEGTTFTIFLFTDISAN